MSYVDFIAGFRNFYIQERIEQYGKRVSPFIDLSKELQQDVKVVERFEILDKGCQLWVRGEKYPIRGNTPATKVVVLTQYKRMVPMWINFLFGRNDNYSNFAKKNKFQQAIILLGMLVYQEFFINWLWYGLQDLYADVNFYGQPVRELYRVLDGKLRDIICAVLEYDTAYRYRFQDIVGELNKENFKKSPFKEIERLADIARGRECQEHDDKQVLGLLKLIKFVPVFIWYLRINRKLLKKIQEVVEKLDINEVKLSVEDTYWTNQYKDYNFRGLTFKERMQEYEFIKAN